MKTYFDVFLIFSCLFLFLYLSKSTKRIMKTIVAEMATKPTVRNEPGNFLDRLMSETPPEKEKNKFSIFVILMQRRASEIFNANWVFPLPNHPILCMH